MKRVRCEIAGVLIAVGASFLTAGRVGADEAIDFARDVRPILADNCLTCHGPDETTREADLRLDDRESALSVISLETEEESELLIRVLTKDPDLKMPPPGSKKRLKKSQIDVLRKWIEQGAEFERHWAFVPPELPVVPELKQAAGSINEIDRFVLAKLESLGLSPSSSADRITLLRRVTLDLTGLPPTPGEVEAFLTDERQDAYERVIDRLMRSPRYGEHMAAPWLDLARYADTDGYQNDRYRYMHVWRDWVILAFNENKPYNDFLVEQLAGDMLPGATLKQQIATGFCRNHRINSEDGSIPREWHVENVVDRVDTLGTAILGLTMGCARCHEHKYDPITQKDYYRIYAYFNNVPEWGIGPNNGNSPPFIDVPESWPNLAPEEDVARVPEPLKLSRAREEKGNGLRRPQAGSPQTVMVMAEMDEPRPTYFLNRGKFDAPDKSEILTPGVPAALNPVDGPEPRNRLELARWLVHRDHPLTARVAANRLWMQFFGTGIVKTAENFGLQGELPSHPQLLDWLAVMLIEDGWDLRAIQKRILLSATYRQSSDVSDELAARDPENRLLARGPRFRMHPFVLRDQALAASGLLEETVGGPPAKPYMPPRIWRSISNNTYDQDHGTNLYRRSLYTYWRRTIPPPTMMNFNAAAREVCVVRQERTNTPLQALTLMNNVTFVEASRFLAQRMLTEADGLQASIAYGFQLLTARPPTETEQTFLIEAYESFHQHYAANHDAARELLSVGEKPRNPELDLTRHAALTMTASLIMNLDEALSKE